jgi:competence protein ComEA
MERAERRALLLLLGLAVAGQGVRAVVVRQGAPGEASLLADRPDGRPGAHRDSAAAADRPLGAGEVIDVDRAGVRELARLPRVGPALARTIVADREAQGPFGSLAGLDRVPGVGPGLLAQLGPHVRFSGGPLLASPPPIPLSTPSSLSGTTLAEGPAAAAPSLNSSSAEALEGLPGVGPARARALVAWRQSHGPFASAAAVAAVPRIGPRLAQRLWAVAGSR